MNEVKVVITKEEAQHAPKDMIGEYVLRRWTWREKQKATLDSTELLDERKGISSFDVIEYETLMLLTCIKKAPFDVKDKDEVYRRLLEMDPSIGDPLIKAARELNGLKATEAKAFLGPSEPVEDTPGSTSTG